MKAFFEWVVRVLFSKVLLSAVAIVGVVGLFRPDWFYEAKPKVQLELVSNAPVFNVNRRVGKLTILFDGKSITDLGATLRSLSIRVVNDGRISVRKSDYDDKVPLAIVIVGGTLLEPPGVQSGSKYLDQTAGIAHYDANHIVLLPVILEPGDSFTVSALVLAHADERVEITAAGKIAGQTEIPSVDLSAEATRPSFWAEVYAGRPGIQLARLVLYPGGLVLGAFLAVLGFALFLAILALPTDLYDRRGEFVARRQRSEVVNAYLQAKALPYDAARQYVLRRYIFQNKRRYAEYDLLLDLVDGKLSQKDVLIRRGRLRGDLSVELLSSFRAGIGEIASSQEEALKKAIAEANSLVEYLDASGTPRRDERISRSIEGPFYPPEEEPMEFAWAPSPQAA